MPLYVKVIKNTYRDSFGCLNGTFVATEVRGVQTAYVAMGTADSKAAMADLGMLGPEIDAARDGDCVFAVIADSDAAFEQVLEAIREADEVDLSGAAQRSYPTLSAAIRDNPGANIASIAVPGEYALAEAKAALEAGLHVIVFSANVPVEDEQAMKQLAKEKGLLCMGPDCGVAKINGAAFVLGSITARGPFGIVGASGCGIQHVGAMLHKYGSGISQAIGTGGGDLKDPIGGIMMLMGLSALEADPETEYIVIVSRKPGDEVLGAVLRKVKALSKPAVVFMMGASKEQVEAAGGIWAANLDDCAAKALALIGGEVSYTGDEQIARMAREAVVGMGAQQKYVRGAYLGGTYCDEAMRAMEDVIGPILSNAPLRPELALRNSLVSEGNCVIDYGEEEFTRGKPHPTIDPSVRQPAFLREAQDPEVAVILMDMILCPPGPIDPSGAIAADIRRAMALAEARGGKLAVVASVLGTDADLQHATRQAEILREAGALVLETNYRAALLAGEIIRLKRERDE